MPAKVILVVLVALLATRLEVFAEEELQTACIEIISDCLTVKTKKTLSCYMTAEQHPFCQGLKINQILKNRILLENGKVPIISNPKSIDQKIAIPDCLPKMDRYILMTERVSAEELNKILLKCVKGINAEES